MPRSYPLYPQNQRITSNPLSMLSFDPTSIVKSAAGVLSLPDAAQLTLDTIQSLLNELENLPGAAEEIINIFLGWIDDVTGLNLLGFAQELEALFGQGSLLGSLLGSVTGMLGNWTQLFGALGIPDIGGLATAAIDSVEVIGDIGPLLPVTAAVGELFGELNPLSGSFDPIAAVQTFFQLVVSVATELPGVLISDLIGIWGGSSALAQNVIDAFVNLFTAGSGTGNQISALIADAQSALQGLLPAAFDNLDGTSNPVSTLITDLSDGTATFLSDLGSNPIGALVDNIDGTAMSVAALLQNITGGASPIITTAQNIIDSVVNVVSGDTSAGNSLTQFENAMTNIPFDNVLGALGPLNIGESIQSTVDSIVQGLASLTGTGYGLGNLSNATTQTANNIANAQIISQANSTTLANRAATKPSFMSIDPTADSVFHITTITGTTPTTVNTTPGLSVIGMIGTPDAGIKESIIWLGQSTTNLSGMYLNIYQVDTSTGVLTWLYTTPNILSSVSTVLTWNYYNLPSANYITTAQGQWFAVEMVVQGTGVYQIAGIPNHWLPANPNAFPQQLAAARQLGVVYDSTGAGYTTTTTASSISGSWSHTATAGATVIVMVGTVSNNNGLASGFTRTATYGGVGMTSLGVINGNNSTAGWLELFVLQNVAGGAKTVAISVTGGTPTFYVAGANSVSYTGVATGGVSAEITTFASSAAPASAAIPAAYGQTVVQAFVSNDLGSVVTASGYTQTVRSLQNLTNGSNSGTMTLGDAAGTSGSINFAETLSGSAWWSSAAVSLSPTWPTFDATGAGFTKTTTGSTISASWSHTATAGAAVVVSTVIMSNSSGSFSSFTRSATYGGTPMISLGVINAGNSTQGWVELFGLLNVAGGAKTVTWSVSGGSPTYYTAAAQSVSYVNVGAFGTAVTNFGTSTALTTGTISNAQLVAHAFLATDISGAGAMSAYKGTARTGPSTLTNGSANMPYVVGDANITATPITATLAQSIFYGSVAVPLFTSAISSAPTSITSPTYSSNVPWFGLGGSAGASQLPPTTTEYSTNGSYTYLIPTWVNHIDVIVVGAGGQGSCGQFGGGSAGGSSTATVGVTTVTGGGGAGGANGAYGYGYNADDNGKSPGNTVFNGVPYSGGVAVGPDTTGSSPGGGGGGGVWNGFYAQGGFAGSWAAQTFAVNGTTGITTVSLIVGLGGPYVGQQTPGYPGADGAVWIRAYQ